MHNVERSQTDNTNIDVPDGLQEKLMSLTVSCPGVQYVWTKPSEVVCECKQEQCQC